MKAILTLITLLALSAPAIPAQEPAALPWRMYDAGLAQAGAAHKPMMLQVYADWCRECHKLEQEMAGDAGIRDLLRRDFVLARINLGSDKMVRHQGQMLSEKQLALQLQATWPPMLLFYAPDGKLIGRRFGAATLPEIRRMLEHVRAKARTQL